MNRVRAAFALLVASLAPGTLQAQPLSAALAAHERVLEFELKLDGQQAWANGPQSTQATTRQQYRVSTRLRTDGVLHLDNLLEPDRAARIEIKSAYYARQGLLRLKARNGGKLPARPEDAAALYERYRKDGNRCRDSFECNQQVIEQQAAVQAMEDNTPAELDAFLAPYGPGEVPRYLYYFGYAGCPVNISVQYDVQIRGQRAFDKSQQKVQPYSYLRSADSRGSDDDRKTLCEKYVATVDTRTGTLFIENLLLPAPIGQSIRTIGVASETIAEAIGLPPPAAAIDWATATLSRNRDSGSARQVLELNFPLDGDASVQGTFSGKLNADLRWSFKPAK